MRRDARITRLAERRICPNVLPGMEADVGFSGDEALLLVVCGAILALGLWRWTASLRPISQLGAPRGLRAPLYVAAALGFGGLGWVIGRWADPDIPAFGGYVLLVLVMGGAWLTVSVGLFPWLGISLRDDALEQRNAAAVWALAGGILGVMLTFAGSSIGEGPSFWNNVVTGGLATGALLLGWLALASAGGLAHAIAQERDLAAGIRLAGALLALGLVLARAAAGDWRSLSATVSDVVRDGWFAGAIVAGALAAERTLAKRSDPGPGEAHLQRSLAAQGIAPAIVYLAAACAWVWWLGWWEGSAR
jgi:uncharacterized membrane protein YjfL (UPF0719 family)